MTAAAVLAAVLTGVLAAGLVLGARRWLELVRVQGVSMSPTYADGERLLIRRGGRVRRGDVVVFAMPDGVRPSHLDQLVKRVAAVPGDRVPGDLAGVVGAGTVPSGVIAVLGDNPHSLDSRRFGYVPLASVRGVALRARPPVTAGRASPVAPGG